MKCILMNKNTKVLSADYQPSLGVFTDIYDIYNIDFAPVILKNVYNKEKDLKGQMITQGTTPRRITDLIGSLCDLTSGSGDKGTPVVFVQGYFDNYSSK